MADGGGSLLATLENDSTLSPFFDPGFSADAYVRDILRGDTASGSSLDETAGEAELHRLRARAGDIETAIKTLVSSHQDALFAQAGNTAALKRDVDGASARVGAMSALASRLHADVLTPFGELKREARTLEHVLAAMDVLRRVQRLCFNLRRLRSLVGPALAAAAPAPLQPQPAGAALSADAARLAADPRLLARLAPVLREVEDGLADGALAGVAVVEGERAWAAATGRCVREAARSLLHRAVHSLNAADVGGCLTLFHDLACAPAEVVAAVDGAVDRALAAIRSALDVRQVAAGAQSALEGGTGLAPAGPSGGVGMLLGGGHGGSGGGGSGVPGAATRGGSAMMPPAGAAAAWRGVLWSRVEGLCDTLQRLTLSVWSLLYVAARRGGSGSRASGAAARDAAASSSLVGALAHALATGAGLGPHTPAVHPAEGTPIDGDGGDARGCGGGDGAPPHPAVLLLRRFWRAVTAGLFAEVSALTAAGGDASPFVRATLAEAYPRLHYALWDVLAKAGRSVVLRAADHQQQQQQSGGIDASAGGGGEGGPFALSLLPGGGSGGGGVSGGYLFNTAVSAKRLLAAVSPLLRLYLGRSLQRLSEPVHAMFPPPASSTGQRMMKQAAGLLGGRTASLASMPSAASLVAGGLGGAAFTPPVEMDRHMDEPVGEPPSQAATGALIKALLAEWSACRPPASSAAAASLSKGSSSAALHGGHGGSGGGGASGGGAQAGVVGTSVTPDPALFAAVARGIATALKLLATKAEGAAHVGPSALAVGELWLPTPAQALNLAVAARLDEVRRAVARMTGDAPVPHALERVWAAVGVEGGDGMVLAAAAARLEATPLRPPLTPHALALLALLPLAGAGAPALGGSGGSSGSLAAAAATSAQGLLVGALEALDAQVDALLLLWLGAVAGPLERTVSRLCALGYVSSSSAASGGSSSSSSSSSASSSGPLATDSTAPSAAGAAPAPDAPDGGAADAELPVAESEYVLALQAHAAALSAQQLSLLPAHGHVGDAARACLARRLLGQWVRLACLVRPLDAHGRLRLARDAAGVEEAVGALWPHELARLGGPYAELRALRALLFTPSHELLAALAGGGGAAQQPAVTAAGEGEGGANDAAAAAFVTGGGGGGGDALGHRRLAQGSPTPAGEAAARVVRVRALLRALRPANVAHALLARLPSRDASLPYESPAAGALLARLRAQPPLPAPAAAGSGHARLAAYAAWLDDVALAAAAGTAAAAPGGGAWARLLVSDAALGAVDRLVWAAAGACIDEAAQRAALAPPAAPAGEGAGQQQQQQQQQPPQAEPPEAAILARLGPQLLQLRA